MKKFLILIILILASKTFVFSADSTHSYHSIFELGKFLGTWKMEGAGKTVIETWVNVSNQTIEGKSILITSTKVGFDTLSFESLRIVEMEEEVFYIAKPNENPMPVPFKLVSSENKTFVFENNNHDFPKKIIYKFKDDDNIDIEISGSTKQIYLYYKRQK